MHRINFARLQTVCTQDEDARECSGAGGDQQEQADADSLPGDALPQPGDGCVVWPGDGHIYSDGCNGDWVATKQEPSARKEYLANCGRGSQRTDKKA